MTDDKENQPLLDGPPPLILEQKHERTLKRLQRRNSNSKRYSNASSTATRKEYSKTGESESDLIQMSALTAWMNKMLAPSDSLKLGDQADIDLVLNDFQQMKGFLSNKERTTDQAQHQQHKPLPEDPKNNDLIQYFLKSTSETNLVKKLEALLSSSSVLADITKIVDQEKIAVRRDVKVFSNIGIQALLCSILMSFQPVWLCTAMEFIFKREMTFPRDADGKIKYVSGMSKFILRNILDNSAAFANNRKYMRGQSKVLLTDAGIDAVHKDFLGKFLSILFLIETMLVNNLLPDVPCMFWPSSKYKSINDVLTVLSREITTGTSSMKHLQAIGFRVVYRQDFFEEYKYVVNDFQNDLRNGIILARIVEVLSAKLGRNHVRVVESLRNPSGDRLRKVYNVRHVISVCARQFPSRFGPNDFNADDIVAGKCNVLIEFVWRLIGVVLGDEVNNLRRDFMKKYEEKEQARHKEQSSSTRGLDLPELIEMKRLNLAAARIQNWWLIKKAELIKRKAGKSAELVTEESGEENNYVEVSDLRDHSLPHKEQSSSTRGLDLPELIEMKRLNLAAARIQNWWLIKRAELIKRKAGKSAELVTEKSGEENYVEVSDLRDHSLPHKEQSSSTRGLDLPELIEMKRLNLAAARIQNWWLIKKAELIKRKARKPVEVITEENSEENNDVEVSDLRDRSLPQASQTLALSDELMKFREKALEVTKNTLQVQQLMLKKEDATPAKENDAGRVFSPFSYEEFKRHLDDRRKNARYVGIPMRRQKKSTTE